MREFKKCVFLILTLLLFICFSDKSLWGDEKIEPLLKSLNSGRLRIEERNEIRNKILSFDKKTVAESIINEVFLIKNVEEDAYYLVELKGLLQKTEKNGIDVVMNTLQDKNYEKIWWFGLATLIAPPQPAQVEVSDVLKKIISNMLLSKIPQNRSVAVVTIAKFQIKEHVPKIIEIFPKETDSRIKRNIVIELSKVDDERAREFIVSILKNEDAELRLAACIGLSEFKNKISPELLAEIADNDPDKRVRTQAIEAILSTGDVRGLPFIKKFLDSVIFKKENETITSIFNGIPKIKDRKTIDFLEPYLKSDDSYIRFHCALAIGKIGLKEAAPILSKSLNDLDTGVKKQVIRSLGWIGNPESLEVLQKAHSKELDEDTKKEIQKAVELIKSGGRKWD